MRDTSWPVYSKPPSPTTVTTRYEALRQANRMLEMLAGGMAPDYTVTISGEILGQIREAVAEVGRFDEPPKIDKKSVFFEAGYAAGYEDAREDFE